MNKFLPNNLKNLLPVTLLICFVCLEIMTTASAQTIVLVGKVADSTTQQPLAYASVEVIGKNGQVLTSVVTDRRGNFELATTSAGADTLSVAYVGFKTKKVGISFQQLINRNTLGTIFLNAGTNGLATVTVSGKQQGQLFKLDRQVFKAGQFVNAANGTAVDVLRNLPSVSVNGQGEINFRGSGSFLLLINGRPTQGDPSFILSQLPAASIENIEVITSPSAAYDAEGKSGIINVTTIKGAQDGWVVQSNIMGGAPPLKQYNNSRNPQRHGADVSVAYRISRWEVSGGLNYLRNDIAGNRAGDVFTIINNVKTSFPSFGERSFKQYNYGARLSATYQPNKLNSFSTGLYVGKRFKSRLADLLYNNSAQNLATGATRLFTYFNSNDQQKEGNFTLANLDYTHLFLNESKLVLSGLFERAALTGNIFNNNLTFPGLADTLQYTVNPSANPLNAYRFKADYTTKLGNVALQTGYQYRYDIQRGSFSYLTKINGSEVFVADPQFTSDVRTINHIHAGYVQLNGATNKWSYATGLRLEQSDRTLTLSKNNEVKKLALTNLFPSVQLRYRAWTKGTLKAGYSRRIKRINNFELNPIPEREHSETLEQGDAELLPELVGTAEVGMEQTFAGGTFFASLYYQHVKNPLQRVNSIFNDTILNRVYTNAGRATQIGLETNVQWQANKIWQATLGGNVYRYNIEGTIFNRQVAVSNNSWVYSINTNQTFTLPKNWLMQLSVNYLSLRATAQGEDSRFLTPNFTVKKTTNDKRWAFQFQWLNIDAGMRQSNRQRITTFGPNFFSTTNYIYETDQLQCSVSFNLLGKTRKINLPVSEMAEKEF